MVPGTLRVEHVGPVARLTLDRVSKRNALNDAAILGIEAFFTSLPAGVRAVVLDAEGDNFSAGLDLSELGERTTLQGVEHSQMWHRAFNRLEGGGVPVVSVLKGAVIGGGLELACATHIRVAESTAYYALPEGQRGLFVGGGGSVRLPRLIGTHRMVDMMLTGRVHDAKSGHAIGLSHYLTGPGEGLAMAMQLATEMAAISPVTTYAVLQALPRIAEASRSEGFLLESLMASVASSSDEARSRMRAFLEGRAGKVAPEPTRVPGA